MGLRLHCGVLAAWGIRKLASSGPGAPGEPQRAVPGSPSLLRNQSDREIHSAMDLAHPHSRSSLRFGRAHSYPRNTGCTGPEKRRGSAEDVPKYSRPGQSPSGTGHELPKNRRRPGDQPRYGTQLFAPIPDVWGVFIEPISDNSRGGGALLGLNRPGTQKVPEGGRLR